MMNDIEKKEIKNPVVKCEYEKDYSEDSFWVKVKSFAVKAGRNVIGNALTLYYCMKDKDTPVWAKSVIVGALGYFISPLDAIPDIIPMIGFSDDLSVLAAALATVAVHIKEAHKIQARNALDGFFDKKIINDG